MIIDRSEHIRKSNQRGKIICSKEVSVGNVNIEKSVSLNNNLFLMEVILERFKLNCQHWLDRLAFRAVSCLETGQCHV